MPGQRDCLSDEQDSSRRRRSAAAGGEASSDSSAGSQSLSNVTNDSTDSWDSGPSAEIARDVFEALDRGEEVDINAFPPEARSGVEDLIAVDSLLSDLLSNPTQSSDFDGNEPTIDSGAVQEPFPRSEETTGSGRFIGDYELLDFVAHGGTSMVYRARQRSLNRIVALKLVLPQRGSDSRATQRLFGEAEALIRLRHPHIVTVYEVGQAGDWAFLATDFIDGTTLGGAVQRKQFSPKNAARITQVLAQTVQFAHDRGVLHRDLKPSNVLLDSQEWIWLADFGLAKQLNKNSELTETGQIIGTPAFMSPEQAFGNQEEIDERTDVYGLGAILYFLLTGAPPFRGANPVETTMQVRQRDPVAPRRITPNLPRDLEIICLKCLRKRAAARYQTAKDLVDDLDRFLRRVPIQARPVGVAEIIGKWILRNPAIAALFLLTAGLMIGGLAGGIYHVRQVEGLNKAMRARNEELSKSYDTAEQNRLLADANALQARRQAYASDMQLAMESYQEQDVRQMAALLDPYRTLSEETDVRDFSWYHLNRLIDRPNHQVAAHLSAIYSARFSPDGESFLTGGADGMIRRYDGRTGMLQRSWNADQKEINSVRFLPDGHGLLTAGDDGTIRFWDQKAGQETKVFKAFEKQAFDARFFADGTRMLVCGFPPDLPIFDVASGEKVGVLDGVHQGSVEAMDVSMDGRLLATVGDDRIAIIWNLVKQKPLHRFSCKVPYSCVKFIDRDRCVVAGSIGGLLAVWDVDTGKLLRSYRRPDGIQQIAISSKGLMAVADRGGSISLLPVPDSFEAPEVWEPSGYRHAANDRIYGLDFSPDGTRLVCTARSGEVSLWDRLKLDPVITLPPREKSPVNLPAMAAVLPGDDGILLSTADGLLHWNYLDDASPQVLLPEHVYCCDTSDDGQLWIATERLRKLYIFRNAGGKRVRTTLEKTLYPEEEIWNVALIPNSERCLLFLGNGVVLEVDLKTGRQTERLTQINRMSLAPQGTVLLVSGHGTNDLRLIDVRTWKEIWRREGHRDTVMTLDIDVSGNYAVSGGNDRTILLLDLKTGQPIWRHESLRSGVHSLGFSPDGKTLAVGTGNGSVCLFQVSTGRKLMELNYGSEQICSTKFTQDGARLIVADMAFSIFVIDGRPFTE